MRIQKLTLENFRGIPKLSTDIAKSNFAIFGRNGSGKSGVVDAIEFALTGQISRLSGSGTKGVSIKNQAPHVDHREEPENSWVEVEVASDEGGSTFKIKRSPSDPKNPAISPDTSTNKEVLERIEKHSEFVLSRKEILKYVLAEPGQRSQEVQALLDLKPADELRKVFVAAKNDASKDVSAAEDEVRRSKPSLLQLLKISDLSSENILQAVNTQRVLAGLTEVSALNSTSFGVPKTGEEQQEEEKPQYRIAKNQAEKIFQDFSDLQNAFGIPEDLKEDHSKLSDSCTQLLDDETLLKSFKQSDFLKSGLELIEDPECPFCENEWDIESLAKKVKERIASAKKAKELSDLMQSSTKPILTFLEDVKHKISSFTNLFDEDEDQSSKDNKVLLDGWLSDLDEKLKLLRNPNDLGVLSTYLAEPLFKSLDSFPVILKAGEKIVKDIPSVDTQQEAISCLDKSGVLYQVYVTANDNLISKQAILAHAKKLETLFNEALEESLEEIYSEVESDFTNYYRLLNADDEGSFSGEFKATKGALSLSVDFYGRGKFPPIAYHSEGHQDSMGICLHLSLMKRMLGSDYTLGVLDDVLMSIDSGHRRQFLSLLSKEFPKTQFILTTHDPVWFRQMQADGFVKRGRFLHFKDWNVETGPVVGDPIPLMEKAAAQLKDDDVNGASHSLRFGIELAGAELAERLRPNVPYSSTASWDLGDIWPKVVSTFKKHVEQGIKSAKSWDKPQLVEELESFLAELVEARDKSNVDYWAINKNVHYTEWANFQREDLLEVLKAFTKLLALMKCKDCSVWLHLSPLKGTPESLRCSCNNININLVKKPKEN